VSFFADSNRSSLRYIAETVWGTTPASGTSREMRLKNSKLSLKKETKTSDEIRADRMVPSIIDVGAASEGEIDFEFSAGAVDDFLAAFVYGAWSRPMTMDSFHGNVAIASTSTVTIVSDIDYSPYFTVGRKFKLEGFVKPSNNGYFSISSVAHSGTTTTITVTGTPLTVAPATAYTKLLDANDVIVAGSTAIRFGTSGASTIDSNGGNLFSSAIAAGQLKVGQKIHVDGLGLETGTVDFADAPVAGDIVIVNDGVKQVTFEFGTVATTQGNIVVALGADGTGAATNFVTALNLAYSQSKIAVMGVASTHDTDEGLATLTNYEAVSGGALSKVGDVAVSITVTNFSGGDNSLRGVFTVTSVANDIIGVSPQPATNANSGTKKVTVKGSMLRNPGVAADFVAQQYSIETAYEDVGQYFINRGLRVSQFDLDVQSREIVTGKLQFMGEGMERRITKTSKLKNSPYTALVSTPGEVMSASTNVGNITKNGTPLSTALKSISIAGDAGLREQQAVGHKFPVGIGAGRFKLTGKFAAYFEDGDMFDDFISHATVSLSWYFNDIDNQRYYLTLPAIKLTSDPLSPGAIDQDVMEDIDWEAQRDPNTNCMIQIDRFSSVKTPTF
jgi:hypothetical protein